MGTSDFIKAVSIIVLFSFIAGCAGVHRPAIPGEETKISGGERRGNAFLFDIKVDRNGKKNSARLDIYQCGDSLSFFARGYLGKGVMKGLLTADSVIAYFPTEGEFYTGKLAPLIKDTCDVKRFFEQMILAIFRRGPSDNSSFTGIIQKEFDSLGGPNRLIVNFDKFHIKFMECGFTLDFSHDRVKQKYVLKTMEYFSPDSTFSFAGKRREYRPNMNIPSDKMEVVIPQSAVRISP